MAWSALEKFKFNWLLERGFPEADVLLIVQDSGLGATENHIAKEKLNFGCISVDSYRGKNDDKDIELLNKLATEVESEWGTGGLSSGLYFDWAVEIAKRFHAAKQGRIKRCPGLFAESRR